MARRMGLAVSAEFCRRFGTAFRAGIDLLTLCRAEAKYGSDRHRSVMARVAGLVSNGSSLTDAMVATDERYFPTLLLSMVRLGEQTGRLERTMLQLANHYQQQLATRRAFLVSIAWPVLQLIAGVFVVGLLIWLLGILKPPGGGEMFDPLGLGLRGNKGLLQYMAFVLTVAGAIFFVVQSVRRNWFNVHSAIPVFYMLPKLGPAIQTITLARFCWTFSMCSESGLDPFRSIDLAMDSTGSDYYRSETLTAQKVVQEGGSMVDALAKTNIFPAEFLSAMEVAELSGTDAESLGHLAHEYDQRARLAMKTLAGLLTGVIWLTVVGILVFVIMRMALSYIGVINDALQPI